MNEKCWVKNCCPFIVMILSLIFDPVSVPWKGEREQRLRICKITSPKGKRKNAGTKNLKQEEKTILKIKKKNRNKRLKQFLTRIKVLK